MSDLRTLMHNTAGPVTGPIAADVARADRVRGTRALRRRRVTQLGGGSALAVVATVGIFAIVAPSSGVSTPPTSPGVASRTVESGPSNLSGTALVAYTGPQPVGYVLDKVPAGWAVRLSDASLLILAPAGATPAAKPGPAKGGVEPISVADTISVSIQSDMGVPTGVRLDKVTVDGRPAVIAHMNGAGSRTLFAKQPSGAYLEIQVWSGLGWDLDRIVEFAESVHVTKDAEEVRG